MRPGEILFAISFLNNHKEFDIDTYYAAAMELITEKKTELVLNE